MGKDWMGTKSHPVNLISCNQKRPFPATDGAQANQRALCWEVCGRFNLLMWIWGTSMQRFLLHKVFVCTRHFKRVSELICPSEHKAAFLEQDDVRDDYLSSLHIDVALNRSDFRKQLASAAESHSSLTAGLLCVTAFLQAEDNCFSATCTVGIWFNVLLNFRTINNQSCAAACHPV